MAFTLRVVKGSPLTITELDGNFEETEDRLISLEDMLPVREILEIRQVGNSLIVDYTDSTSSDPFTFEVNLTFRGEWQPSTAYNRNDLVNANGVVYLVLQTHTSDTVFDPGATSGSDGDLYQAFIEIPGLQLPAGGGTGYVLGKASAVDYDVEWQNSGLPIGGSTGFVLTKLSPDDHDADWAASAPSPVAEIASASFEPVLSSANIFFVCTHSSGCLVRIPEDSSVEFPIGTELHFCQDTLNGSVIIVGQDSDNSVSIEAPLGYEPLTALFGAVITVKKIDIDRWKVFGLVASEEASDTA